MIIARRYQPSSEHMHLKSTQRMCLLDPKQHRHPQLLPGLAVFHRNVPAAKERQAGNELTLATGAGAAAFLLPPKEPKASVEAAVARRVRAASFILVLSGQQVGLSKWDDTEGALGAAATERTRGQRAADVPPLQALDTASCMRTRGR